MNGTVHTGVHARRRNTFRCAISNDRTSILRSVTYACFLYLYVTLTFQRRNLIQGSYKVNQIEDLELSDASQGQKPGNRFAKLGMVACCIIMMVPIVLVLLSGASIRAVFSNAGLILPLVLCLGMHFVMHRMMGRSCHGDNAKDAEATREPEDFAAIPLPVRVDP